MVLALTVGQHLEMTWACAADRQGLSSAGRKVLAELAQPSEFANLAPADRTVLVVATRLDCHGLGRWPSSSSCPRRPARRWSTRSACAAPFGKVFRDMLAQLGPDAAFAVIAPAQSEKQWTPHVLWALKVRPLPGRTTRPRTSWTA